MRTLLFWLLGGVAALLAIAGGGSLLGELPDKPVLVPVKDASGVEDRKWIEVTDGWLAWRDGVVLSNRNQKAERYFIPVVAAEASRTLAVDTDQIRFVAEINVADGAEYGFDGQARPEMVSTQNRPMRGVVRAFDKAPDHTQKALRERFQGLDVPVLAVGQVPLQKDKAQQMFLMGGVGLLIWGTIWRKNRKGFSPGPAPRSRVGGHPQAQPFFVAMFSMLGKLAKADGRVSPEEIELVQRFMDLTGLDAGGQKVAIDIFNGAKNDQTDIREYAQVFAKSQPDEGMRAMAYQVLFDLAHVDGELHPEERAILEDLPRHLGLDPNLFRRTQTPGSSGPTLEQAYEVLGCAATSTDEEVTRAYRTTAAKFHPDKLASKGLPQEFMEFATRQMQAANQAFQIIKKARGM